MSFDQHKRLRESLSIIRKDHYRPSHIAVLECLAYELRDNTGLCFPSEARIARDSYLSERHVRKILGQLAEDGLIEIIPRARTSNRYKLHFPGKAAKVGPESQETMEAFQGPEQVSEGPQAASDSRLTYNSNQSLNPIRDSSVSLLLNQTPSESILSDTGTETGKPVPRFNQKASATPEVLKLHSLLMKKVRSSCPEPSIKDVRLLSEAIEQYGLAELYQVVEGIFRQKNKFWRDKLKTATYPCSLLSRSLPTIIGQFSEAEESEARWAKQEPDHGTGNTAVNSSQPDEEMDESFGSFDISEEELD